MQEILKSVLNFKKWLKYDVTKKISIIEDVMQIICFGNYSILKLFIWQEKLQLNSNTMGVTVMLEKQWFPPKCWGFFVNTVLTVY